jgi:Zn-dependent M28 family amino/carboxypeptidase
MNESQPQLTPKRANTRSSTLKRIAIIVCVMVASALAFAWITMTQPFSLGTPASTLALPLAPDAAMSATLERHVRTLAVDYHSREYRNRTNLDRTASYIEQQLKAIGLQVVEQPYEVKGHTYKNIVASVGNPESKERFVIGAHYDAAGTDNPGADDNASGVAGLIELARLLKARQAERPFQHRIELVAWTLEEPPFFRTKHMGSYVHAQSLKSQQAQVVLMMSLECIGYFSDEPNSQDYPVNAMKALYPSIGNFIGVIGRIDDDERARRVKFAMKQATPLPVESINAPSFMTGIDFSDQLNYWNEGYTGLMITNTAFYRNKAYHTPEDTADRLDYKRMAQVVQGIYAAVVEIDAKP